MQDLRKSRYEVTDIHKVRIEKSTLLMKEQQVPIKEVAERVGYQNMNQFYKYFAKETDMTPAAYLRERQ